MTPVLHEGATPAEVIDDITEEDLVVLRIVRPFLARCLSSNHDFASPLAGILGFAEFLKGEADSLSDDQMRYVENILTCAEQIRAKLEILGNLKMKLSDEVDIDSLIKRYEQAK